MLPITLDRLIQHLTQYVRQTGEPVDLILVGGLALQAYGFTERVTVDVEGEMIHVAAESAIAASSQDTAMFLFRKTVDVFCKRLNVKR